MPQLYLIERDFGGFTDPEVTSAAYRAKVCAMYYPGMRWVRSLYDRTTQLSLCLYEAGKAEDIRRHAWAIVVPCEDVRPVTEAFPPDVVATEAGRLEPLRGPGVEGVWLTTLAISEMAGDEVERFTERLFEFEDVARVFHDAQKSELLVVTSSRPEFPSESGTVKVAVTKWVSEVMPDDIDAPAELVAD